MYLKSIEISGFKSFADKTVFQFGHGITSIVGPNGSGKSNISDAVRWVLGEQSTKNLRGQSMEDVIFNGTSTRRPASFAEVTLVIDNSDRSMDFDNDTVAVTRRYYRSHESEYLVNKAVVRLKDVNELFMDTGLGRDGYSMIGQGKIDNIVGSKSKERRDIFEEASGISKYRYRKLESEHKLEAAEDNLLRLRDILAELEGRVGPLEEQSKKAQKFLEFSADKKELEIGLWLNLLDRSGDLLKNQEEKIAIAKAQYNSAEENLSELAEKIEKSSDDFSGSTVRIDELSREIASMEENIARTEGDIAVIENSIKFNIESINRITGDINDLAVSDETAKEEIENRKNLIEEKNKYLNKFKEQVTNESENLSSLLLDSESVSKKIEELNLTLNAYSAELSENRVKMVTAQTGSDEINARISSVSQSLEIRSGELKKNKAEFDNLQKDFDRAEEVISECENSLKGYQLRYDTRKASADDLKAKINEIGLDIEEKKRRIIILEDLEKNMEGFGHSVKQVMNVAKSGGLQGVHGPVTRLISVKNEYAVAIETALAAASQNIIVDTEADAKRAIQWLKSNKQGRATFLPIEKIKANKITEKGLDDLFGFVGIASDLLKTDSKYSGILDYLLGRTIVSEDLDSAARIAKKFGNRYKVVSLDGQVLNPGGSLTGGSLAKNIGLLSRKGDIDKLNDDIEKLTAKKENFNIRYDEAVSNLAVVESDIVSAQGELKTANEDKIRLLVELRRVNDVVNACDNDIKSFTTEKEELENRIKNMGKDAKEAAEKIQELESGKAKAQLQIDSISGGRDDISKRRDDISARLTDLRIKVMETEKDIASAEESLKNLEDAINNRASKNTTYNDEIEKLNVLNAEHESKINLLKAGIENTKKGIEEKRIEVKSLNDMRDNADKNSQEMRRKERETTAEKEKIGGEVARLEERKETMMREYDEIISKLYDEYELTVNEARTLGISVENHTEAKKRLSEIKSKIKSLGNVNVGAIEEFKEVSERYTFMKEQLDDVEKSRMELIKLIDRLTVQMREMFIEGFGKINENFKTTFGELFAGGVAELKLTDEEDILESGIDINVKLPGKNVPSIDGLSGGEKALIALSIYFAIMKVSPPAFCFLDEVDTALDDINVDRFAEYMKRGEFPTQFICITHRRGTMEAADMLYGVTMQEKGVTKLLELNVEELVKTLNLEKA